MSCTVLFFKGFFIPYFMKILKFLDADDCSIGFIPTEFGMLVYAALDDSESSENAVAITLLYEEVSDLIDFLIKEQIKIKNKNN